MTYYNTPDGPLDPEVDLDLTSEHLHNLDGVELKSTLKFLDLTANRLNAIDPRILALSGLEVLSLRQNLLTDASAFSGAACKATLRELVLHDNKLTEIPNLSGFSAFTRLEFSYNEIRSLEPLKLLDSPTLVELYVAVNKVTQIAGISHFTSLQILELGSNRLRMGAMLSTHRNAPMWRSFFLANVMAVGDPAHTASDAMSSTFLWCAWHSQADGLSKEITGLDNLVELRQLWLGRNRITAIQNLGALTNLRQLSIQSNRLESMKGIGVLSGLEELYLSENGIKCMEDLDNLTNLKILDLAHNSITKVEGLEQQTQLTDLWLNDNPIQDLDHLDKALSSCKSVLATLYLEKSPAAKSKAYLHIMKAMLPALEFLDSTAIHR